MVAGHAGDRAQRAFGRHAEGVALALDDERRDLDGVQLRESAFRGLARLASRRLEREGEAENGDRPELGRGATGDARAEGAAADDEREACQLVRA